MSFTLSYDVLGRLHEQYYDEGVSDDQRALYTAFPHNRGFSDRVRNAERFKAALHLALLSTIPSDGIHGKFRPSYLLVPRRIERWVLEQTNVCAKAVYSRFVETKNVGGARVMAACYKSMLQGHHVHQMHGEPERWVAFGFSVNDAIPEWMKSRLIRP